MTDKKLFNFWTSESRTKAKLTSKLAKQYQQNTCLHRLHIIWAQPSSFSIGTEHIGQHLMRSLSNGMPMVSSSPMAAKRLIFSSQLRVWCHYKIRMFSWSKIDIFTVDVVVWQKINDFPCILHSQFFYNSNKIHPNTSDIVLNVVR